MTRDNATEPLWQASRTNSSTTGYNIPARLDPKTGQHIVLWREIQQAFTNPKCLINNGNFIPFLLDNNFE
ncbi:hypothetical protein BGX26_002562, partial [Mortierella sp. AD094]